MKEKEEKPLEERQFKGYWKRGDDEVFTRNQKYAQGGRLSDLLRLMMYVFWRLPIPDELQGMAYETGAYDIAQESPGADVMGAIEELQQMMFTFDERLTSIDERTKKLEQVDQNVKEIRHLWREFARMNDRFEQLRVTGAAEDDPLTTPITKDAERQAKLSAKLKGMDFREL